MPAKSTQFICPGLQWITPDTLQSEMTGLITDCPCPTHFKIGLSRWSRFKTLDDAALDFLERPGLRQSLTESKNTSVASIGLRTIRAILEACRQAQRSLLASDPEYVRTRQLLQQIADSGVLISEEELLSRCTADETGASTPSVETIVASVGYFRHPDKCEVRLRSFMDYFSSGRSKPRLIITGQSCSAPDMIRLRNLCNDGSVTSITLQSRSSLADVLEREGIPPDVARFSVLGVDPSQANTGAERNALILMNHGKNLLMYDSQVSFSPVARADSQIDAQLEVKRGNLEELRILHTIDCHAPAPLCSDVLEAHESVLGKPLSHIIPYFRARGGVDCNSMCDHLIRSLLSGSGWVRVTTTGVLGRGCPCDIDCAISIAGASGNRWYFEKRNSGEQRATMMLNKTRSFVLSHQRPTAQYSLALNLQSLIPPFMPCGDNDQDVFLCSLFHCCPETYSIHLPFNLPMAITDQAFGRDLILAPATRMTIQELLVPTILYSRAASDDAASSIKALGAFLIDVSSSGTQDFQQQIQMFVNEDFERNVHRWLSEISCLNTSHPLLALVREWIGVRRKLINGPELFHVSDTINGKNEPSFVEDYFRHFGRLLQWWPDMVTLCKERSQTGTLVA